MFEWGISEVGVRQVLHDGEVIEQRPDEQPFPVRLVLGWVESRPIHVVAAFDDAGATVVVITVYQPDPRRWTDGFRRRR